MPATRPPPVTPAYAAAVDGLSVRELTPERVAALGLLESALRVRFVFELFLSEG
jgi:hypothetical protein